MFSDRYELILYLYVYNADMNQAVSHRSVSDRKDPIPLPGQSKRYLSQKKQKWDRFLSAYFIFPVNIIPPMLHAPLYVTVCSYLKDKRAKSGNFPKKECSLETLGALDEKIQFKKD